ncbi:hypothetical protein GUITHDRAFT_60149, partial [Guillardia theta CCMP2712]
LVVHQGCFGIRPYPGDDPWYCDLCGMMHPCLAYILDGGALKPTFDGKFFAHLSCVIWIPEAHVVNTSTMSPVEIRHIPKERLKLKCQICKQKDAPFDAPVQCYESSCSRNFHVGCARASG